MKARLITNGMLSVMILVSYILIFTGAFTTNSSDVSYYFLFLVIMLVFLHFVSFVMGIITLAMEKDESVIGLTIASGVIGILSGLFFVNAIVSFIAVFRMSKDSESVEDSEKHENIEIENI